MPPAGPSAGAPFALGSATRLVVSSLTSFPPGRVLVKLGAALVEVWHAGRCVTTYERCYGRGQEVLNLEHCLEVLERKPGALAGSTPLAPWRQQGRWPQSYDTFCQGLMTRLGKQPGARAMIGLLQLGRTHCPAAVQRAIETALTRGVQDSAAVRHLVATPQLERPQPTTLAIGALGADERALPSVALCATQLAVAG